MKQPVDCFCVTLLDERLGFVEYGGGCLVHNPPVLVGTLCEGMHNLYSIHELIDFFK